MFKMNITRSNYESWFLDFLEGNLDPKYNDEFVAFVIENPDLSMELEIGVQFKLLSSKAIVFDSKEQLKKWVNEADLEFQRRAVAFHEGDLTPGERVEFEAMVAENNNRAFEAEHFGKLKLSPDPSIIYENKDQLKRRRIVIPLLIRIFAAAAMVILAYLIFQPDYRERPAHKGVLADLKTQNKKEVNIPESRLPVTKSEIAGQDNAQKKKPMGKFKQKTNPAAENRIEKAEPVRKVPVAESAPALLKPRSISFSSNANIELALIMPVNHSTVSREVELSELLKVQLAEMRNSDDREFLSTEHLGLSGLQLFARLSGKRLTAKTGEDGVVRSVSFNSHLLAFSIPVNR